jgi:outer membrane immunogenic protein
MLRGLLVSTVAIVALSGGAFAADLPSRMEPPTYIPPPPVFSWTGFYAGINGGYGGDQVVFGLAGASTSLTSSGFLGGGQVGFNYQFLGSNIVAGIEADADASTIRGQLGASAPGVALSEGAHLDYLGTVRGRLGYAVGNILPYVTGGFAYGETTTYNIVGLGNENNQRIGWTAGAGLEYAITHNLSFKTEYLYVDLGTKSLVTPVPGIFASERTTFNIVRAGLDWKFDWFTPPAAPPVMAKY